MWTVQTFYLKLYKVPSAEFIFLIIIIIILLLRTTTLNILPGSVNFTDFWMNFGVALVCPRQNGVYRRDQGRAYRRGDTPCPLRTSYWWGGVSSCCSLQTDSTQQGRPGLSSRWKSALLAARTQRRPVGGGRDSAAAAPYILFDRRERRAPPAPSNVHGRRRFI